MISSGPAPPAPTGIWLLEGVSCSGKSTLLRRWRRETAAPVLWAAEDLATQRLFEPLSARHRPEAVEPWLWSLIDGWRALQARASGTAWGEARHGFLALQERFHLSAALEGGLGPGGFERFEEALAQAGARGLLRVVSASALAERLEASQGDRPEAWSRWLISRHGSLAGAVEGLLAAQDRFRALAAQSRLPWIEAEN